MLSCNNCNNQYYVYVLYLLLHNNRSTKYWWLSMYLIVCNMLVREGGGIWNMSVSVKEKWKMTSSYLVSSFQAILMLSSFYLLKLL